MKARPFSCQLWQHPGWVQLKEQKPRTRKFQPLFKTLNKPCTLHTQGLPPAAIKAVWDYLSTTIYLFFPGKRIVPLELWRTTVELSPGDKFV